MAFEELKQKQSVMWGTGPYEQLPAHYRPLLDHVAHALAPRPGERVLDAACGTGALATRLARSGADVTGLDLAPALIDTAEKLAAEEGLAVTYRVGDAENLPFADGEFDAIGSSVGTMFAPDHAAVARELARVCKPGGRIALGHWSDRNGVVDMFKVMAPYMPAPPAGAGSPFTWGNREHCHELLDEHFELRFEEGDAPQRGADGEEVWRLFSTVYGPTRTLSEKLEPAESERLHADMVRFFDGYRGDGGVHQPRPFTVVIGTRRG